MLVTSRVEASRADGRSTPGQSDDRGAAIVMIVIVMFVGMIASIVIAGSVLFAIQANAGNKSTTQAFVSAESGRDAMLAAVMANPCAKSIPASTTAPLYLNVKAEFGADPSNLTDACLSNSAAAVIRITATGQDVDGANTTVVSDYQRGVRYDKQPGGTLAYFAGQFKLTQSTYLGDLVIRTGHYECNSTTAIDGDLWAPKGSIELSANCHVTGNVYAQGAIATKGSGVVVGKNIVSEGDITLESNGGSVGGNVMAAGDVTVKNMTVAGNVTAGGSTADVTASLVTGTVSPATPLPADAFVPSLQNVYDMTTWVDFPSTLGAWGGDVDWRSTSCSGDVTALITAPLAAGKTRVGVDYTACSTAVTIKVGGSHVIRNDVLFLVPPGATMNVQLGAMSVGSPTPQLFFIHADNTPDRAVTCPASVGSGGDSLTQTVSGTAKVLIYTPCGIKTAPKMVGFAGQYYSGDSGSTKLEQPDFVCEPMAWEPRIDLGCKLSEAPDGSGDIVTTLLSPSLLTQTELEQ
ncbi:hypothetical protein [Microbacterium sp. CFBP9034]|uniref:hypothetical protein n=1 Tax=Microbacterium sp. CFBP9034 TaxID=3096540 RepID=UPI002A69B4F5|nr:hypothetical protein [Microbacterium sp. CFBP9034]MDY0910041.1 hypothetical protein [Microbacterium sp. CFBP9034]